MKIYINTYSLLSLLMIIVAGPLNGMRTVEMRRESMQAHRIALKQVSRAAHVYARVQHEQACVQREKLRVVAHHDVCEPMNFDTPDDVRYPVILRFQGHCAEHRMVMATIYVCMFACLGDGYR